NPAAGRWLDELGAGDRPGGHLPVAVRAAASRARAAADGGNGGDGRGDGGLAACLARARIRTPAGRWVVVRGSLLGDGPGSRVAVLLEAARSPELAPLIADAYGFTERERLVTELVARGLPTSEIAGRLHLSAYTVQDHLKSIFEKSGTGSRGDLVARLFFDHYAPRLTPHGTTSAPMRERQSDSGRSAQTLRPSSRLIRWGSGWVRYRSCARSGWSSGRCRRGADRPSSPAAA